MKPNKLVIALAAIAALTGCKPGTKRIELCNSQQIMVKYAYYSKCVEDGSAVVFTEEKPELGACIEKIELSDGSTYYFYPAEGYEFV